LAEIRNNSVFMSLTCHAALLAEVDSELEWPSSVKPELREVWAILVPGFDPAAEVHRLRYAALLE